MTDLRSLMEEIVRLIEARTVDAGCTADCTGGHVLHRRKLNPTYAPLLDALTELTPPEMFDAYAGTHHKLPDRVMRDMSGWPPGTLEGALIKAISYAYDASADDSKEEAMLMRLSGELQELLTTASADTREAALLALRAALEVKS